MGFFARMLNGKKEFAVVPGFCFSRIIRRKQRSESEIGHRKRAPWSSFIYQLDEGLRRCFSLLRNMKPRPGDLCETPCALIALRSLKCVVCLRNNEVALLAIEAFSRALLIAILCPKSAFNYVRVYVLEKLVLASLKCRCHRGMGRTCFINVPHFISISCGSITVTVYGCVWVERILECFALHVSSCWWSPQAESGNDENQTVPENLWNAKPKP